MSQSDSDDDAIDDGPTDGKVGYKNPPEATRFKRGQSGNPNGRPKKAVSLREVFRRELSGPMLFKVGGKTTAFDSREAYVRALVKSACKGSVADIRMIVDLDRAGSLAAALIVEQQRKYGVLVVPRPAKSEEEWERLYSPKAPDATAPTSRPSPASRGDSAEPGVDNA
jgi:Family of unknown function (DUF5681)